MDLQTFVVVKCQILSVNTGTKPTPHLVAVLVVLQTLGKAKNTAFIAQFNRKDHIGNYILCNYITVDSILLQIAQIGLQILLTCLEKSIHKPLATNQALETSSTPCALEKKELSSWFYLL